MPELEQLTFCNHFARLGKPFAEPVKATALSQVEIISVSQSACDLLALDVTHTEALRALLACEAMPPQAEPIASVYSGHQFGHYNPQLGDGRALLIGQVQQDGQLWELQIKGSGPTPYSRGSDGRAVLRSSIREYLCSEAMAALGIASTRALALATSSTPVYREQQETAATLLRLAPSHIRFGHFEYYFYTKQHAALKQLADFVIEHHFNELHALADDEKYALWLTEVVKRTADMIARWQANGFSHGVMNTDNMSILGLTIDYGPFGFMDDFQPSFVCNHSDHQGRYAYNKQIEIGLWNLNALAHSLTPLISEGDLRSALSQYEPMFMQCFAQLMQQKLGLYPIDDQLQEQQEKDHLLIQQTLQLLAANRVDYHFFFRQLSYGDAKAINGLRNQCIDIQAFDVWYEAYTQRLELNEMSIEKTHKAMRGCNPKFVLRNYIAQWAIDDAERGNYETLNEILSVLQRPYDEHEGLDKYAKLPPDWGKRLQVSCSS